VDNPQKITAEMIEKLLLNKHSEDICIPECKSGATWSARKMRKFDIWVMKKSYTQPMTWIYEIKVARNDFLQDDKWQTYLPYCSEFYFVAPAGIIDPSEVPEQAGLLLSSKNATRLYCKKKAPHRDIKIPEDLFKYILMSRVKIVNSTYTNKNNGNDNRKRYWQNWLAEKKENQELGYNVSNKIRQLYNKNVELVKSDQRRLEMRIEKLENAKKILDELGFNSNNLEWAYETKIRERITEINEGFPEKDIVQNLKNAIGNLQNIINVIQLKNKE